MNALSMTGIASNKADINWQDLSLVTCITTADISRGKTKERRVAVFSPLDKRFDRFLYASILERDGLPVSVLSALTRQDLDPWEEATRLAGLPRNEAIDSLAATIWRSSSAISRAAASETASRLVELLPPAESADSFPHGSEDPLSLWLVCGMFLFMMALSANTNPQPKNDPAHQPAALAVGQAAKAPSDTTVLMQSRK